MKKRICAVFLVLVLVFSLMPQCLAAAEEMPAEVTAEELPAEVTAEELPAEVTAEEDAPEQESAKEEAYDVSDEDHLIVGVASILSGLDTSGKIKIGKPVTFGYVDLMCRNSLLRQMLEDGEDTTVGIRKSNGETVELVPEGLTYSFTATREEGSRGLAFWIYVKVDSTGEIFESNVPLYINPYPPVTLSIIVKPEGAGTVTASTYEAVSGENIKLTITPAEGWYYDGMAAVSGRYTRVAGTGDIITISLADEDTVIEVSFKEVIQSGSCGENAVFSFDTATGTLTISGTGAIADGAFYNDNNHAHEWDAVRSVVIGEGITGIGKEAFYYCTELETVTFPQTLEEIGEKAFYYNKSRLKTVEFPQGLKTIGKEAFSQCYALRSAAIPDGVLTIGDSAFFDDAITEAVVPESVTDLGEGVFSKCKSLSTAVIKAPLEKLPPYTFSTCTGLRSITLPDTLKTIGQGAFSYCYGLQSITLPAGLTAFEKDVFYECKGLDSIVIPSGVTEIPDYTFLRCQNLRSVTLPEELKTIGRSAFEECRSLPSVVIPESVTALSYNSFASCRALKEVNIPSGITVIPDQCFQGAPLTSITLPDGVTEIGDSAFTNSGISSIAFPDSLTKIGKNAFYLSDKGNLGGTLTIPAGVTQIGKSAFYHSDFQTIVNLSPQSFLLSDLLRSTSYPREEINAYLDSSGQEVDTIGTGTYTKKVEFVPEKVAVPTGKTLTYTGKEQTGVAEGAEYTISGNTGTEAGFYTATLALKDQTKFVWSDGTTGNKTVSWKILPGKTARGDMFNLANNVKVTWKEVPGAKYYKVYRDGVTNAKESQAKPVIVTAGLVGWDKEAGLVNGHAYKYRVVASLTGKDDPAGDSTLSYSKVMYRLKTVVIRSAKNTAPGKVTVKYDKTDSGDSYVLQYCEREDMVGAKTKVVLGAANTSYVLSGLKKGKTYYISIRVRKKVDGIDYYTTFGVPKKVKITQ